MSPYRSHPLRLVCMAMLCLNVSAARADGGTSIATAPVVQFGQQQSGTMANGYHAPRQCPIYRSWWILRAGANQEITLQYKSSGFAPLYVFPAGTTDSSAHGVFPKAAASVTEKGGRFVMTTNSAGDYPMEFVVEQECNPTSPPSETYTFTASVRDAPAPAPQAFLDAWRKADQAAAAWDLIGARDAITPLLATATTLNQVQRLWFDVSAERILGFTGSSAAATPFHHDADAYLPPGADPYGGDNISKPRPYESTRAIPRRGPTAPSGPTGCMQGSADDLLDSFDYGVVFGGIEGTGHYRLIGNVPQPSGYLFSYFGRKLKGTFGYACHALLTRLSGGATGGPSGTSKYVVVIPSTQDIVAHRKLRRGTSFEVQAFAVKPGKKLIATWRDYNNPKKLIRRRYAVSAEQLHVMAPPAGKWDLQLGIGTNRDFATGITGVRVS